VGGDVVHGFRSLEAHYTRGYAYSTATRSGGRIRYRGSSLRFVSCPRRNDREDGGLNAHPARFFHPGQPVLIIIMIRIAIVVPGHIAGIIVGDVSAGTQADVSVFVDVVVLVSGHISSVMLKGCLVAQLVIHEIFVLGLDAYKILRTSQSVKCVVSVFVIRS